MNRRWHIAGHKLRAPSTTVSSATQPNRLTVVDATDLESGDLISVAGESAFIKRVSGSELVQKSDDIVNYEISKRVRETKKPMATLSRLSVAAVVDGKYDDLPEQAFYMVGGIEEVIEKAEKLKG